MRDGYRELAAREPQRWIVVDNSDRPLQAIVDLVVAAVQRARQTAGGASGHDNVDLPFESGAPPLRARPSGTALSALLDWVDRRAPGEPNLAAHMLAGLFGPAIDQRRIALAEPAPEITAFGLLGLGDPTSWHLRRLLLERAPRQVARSLGAPTPACDQKDQLGRELVASAPAELVIATRGDASPAAFGRRDTLYASAPAAVMASLATLGDAQAWDIRERWLAGVGGLPGLMHGEHARAACRSVTGLDDQRAWEIRTGARGAAPVAALASLTGVASLAAWRWRTELLSVAPKTALGTLYGMDDPRAWTLREVTAARCKEALDSMWGLDGPRAWTLRDACADLWPGAVVKSLGGLAQTPRGEALVAAVLGKHPDDIDLLKHAAGIELASRALVGSRAA
jgi:dTMP kinase